MIVVLLLLLLLLRVARLLPNALWHLLGLHPLGGTLAM